MADFPKKQQQCLIPKYLLDYLGEVNELHPDPSDLGGGDNIEPGTGIVITGDDTKTISVDDETVAMVANLSTVAFSGSYSNLSDKPDLSVYELKEDAFTGDYADLTNKPDLSVYELKSEAFSGNYNDLTNKPDLSIYAETSALGDCAYLDENELSIAYSQITGTPNIPTKTSDLYNDSGYITGVTWSDVTGKPTFATVATTGDYDDLINKPTIPVVPTNVSAFNNDAGYITGIDSSDVISALGYTPGTSNFSGDYNDLTNKPTIPSKTSDLTNDSGFITSASLTNYVPFETVSGMKYVNAGNYYGQGYEPGFVNTNMLTQTKNTFKLPVDKSGTIALLSDIPSIPANIPSLTGNNTWTGYNDFGQTTTNTLFTNVLTVPDADSITSPQLKVRDYNSQSLTEYSITIPKATGTMALTSDIPTIPTNVSAFTNDAGYITSSDLPTNHVTTNTNQTITGIKTFSGSSTGIIIKNTGNYGNGIMFQDNNNHNIGFFEFRTSDKVLKFGVNTTQGPGYKVGLQSFGTRTYTAYLPDNADKYSAIGAGDVYLPLSVNGNTASVGGDITLSATSTSTSTVTPTTVTLTFTYSDNTTENVTLMTGASVATTTTTTLS